MPWWVLVLVVLAALVIGALIVKERRRGTGGKRTYFRAGSGEEYETHRAKGGFMDPW